MNKTSHLHIYFFIIIHKRRRFHPENILMVEQKRTGQNPGQAGKRIGEIFEPVSQFIINYYRGLFFVGPCGKRFFKCRCRDWFSEFLRQQTHVVTRRSLPDLIVHSDDFDFVALRQNLTENQIFIFKHTSA